MLTLSDSAVQIVVTASCFVLVLSLWAGGVWLWSLRRVSRAHEIEARLGLSRAVVGGDRLLRLWREGHEATTTVPDRASRYSPVSRFAQMCRNAGYSASPLRIAMMLTLVTLVASLSTALITGSALAVLGVTGVVLLGFWIHMSQRLARRAALCERQLIDALELAARSLRAGHPLLASFRVVAEEIPAPIGTLFSEICQQEALGASLEDALYSAAAASGTPDMRIFAVSVAIQLRTGGDLADMMNRLAAVMRDRVRLNRRVRVVTAQVQLSKHVLIILPLVIFVVLSLTSPEYMEPFYTMSTGKYLLVTAVASLVVGIVIMNRIARIRY
jgi:tight adherence protein B